VVIINSCRIHVGTPTGDFHPITSRPCWAHTGEGFHADQARRQVGDHFQQLPANHLGLDKYRLATLVNTMQSEYILGEIDADCNNTHGLPLANERFSVETQSWQQLLPAASAATSGRGSPFHSLGFLEQDEP
jgi:hypothetical protein